MLHSFLTSPAHVKKDKYKYGMPKIPLQTAVWWVRAAV